MGGESPSATGTTKDLLAAGLSILIHLATPNQQRPSGCSMCQATAGLAFAMNFRRCDATNPASLRSPSLRRSAAPRPPPFPPVTPR